MRNTILGLIIFFCTEIPMGGCGQDSKHALNEPVTTARRLKSANDRADKTIVDRFGWSEIDTGSDFQQATSETDLRTVRPVRSTMCGLPSRFIWASIR